MKHAISLALALGLCLTIAQSTAAQSGPDVIVGDIYSPSSWGANGSNVAYSVGTVSCNIGNANLSWIAGNNLHPVIGQSLYRLKGGKFEQIGQSWLKHGFTALTQNLCNTCSGVGGSVLGIGCSDPYSASLNGQQSNLGPKSEVNASNGVFTYPPLLNPAIPATVGRRLMVAANDVNPALNAGAVYFVEAQYVTQDDAAAGNKNNNTSYRNCSFGSGATFAMSVTGSTQREKPAILAWQVADPDVGIQIVDVPGEGRFYVGVRVTSNGNGTNHFEFAVFNQNSDRSAQAFNVTFPSGTPTFNAADNFHDVDYHSGEPYSGTDWTPSVTGSTISWATQTFAQNANANALRWATTYSFRFDAVGLPSAISIDLFKPGSPTSISVPLGNLFPAFSATVEGLQSTIVPDWAHHLRVKTVSLSGSADVAASQIFVSTNNGPFVPSALSDLGNGVFGATISGVSGTLLKYYFSIVPTGGGTPKLYPAGAPTAAYASQCSAAIFADSGETNLGWTVSGTATDGAWERAVPSGGATRGDPLNDADQSSGNGITGFAFLTNDGPGNTDVDNGATTMTSPVIDLSGLSTATLTCKVWHNNTFGGSATPAVDMLVVEMSSNGTTWVTAETITVQTVGWETRTYNIGSFVSLTSTFRVRFTSNDSNPQSVVESGVDAILITSGAGNSYIGNVADGLVGINAGPVQKVLTVNGSTGGFFHRVNLGIADPITFSMAQPSTTVLPAVYTVYGYLTHPVAAEEISLPYGLGNMAFTICDLNPSYPNTFLFTDNIGVTACPGIIGSTPTPFSVVLPATGFPVEFTLQGLIYDPSSTAFLTFSPTNAVIVSIN